MEFWKKNAFYFLFLIFLILLVYFYGHIGKGSRRWIEISGFYFLTSEFMKIYYFSTSKIFDEKKIKDASDYFS